MEFSHEQEQRLTTVEERSKSNSHRIDDMEKRQDSFDELVSTVKVLADREKRVEDDVAEIKKDVKSFTGKAGQRWESLVEKTIMMVVAAVVGFILAKIGLT